VRQILTANNITKCFTSDGKKITVANNVCFFLNKNEFCSLVGESGSGKTTLVRIMSGLISPDSGDVICDGENITPKLRRKNKALCAKLQLVLQNSRAALDPRFSVYDCIAEPIRNLKKCSREEERKIVWQYTEQMELTQNILAQRSGELSGGQQKRICIARALAADPDYIIFDEAVSGLDASVRKSVLDLLVRIQKSSGKGFLLITHDIDAALYTSQRIAVMKNGTILENVDYSGDTEVFRSDYSKILLNSSLSKIKSQA
jgi:ATPase components of various ABC-type transport systems, contain duplicated ATPase